MMTKPLKIHIIEYDTNKVIDKIFVDNKKEANAKMRIVFNKMF